MFTSVFFIQTINLVKENKPFNEISNSVFSETEIQLNPGKTLVPSYLLPMMEMRDVCSHLRDF